MTQGVDPGGELLMGLRQCQLAMTAISGVIGARGDEPPGRGSAGSPFQSAGRSD
jgi:hypothetical protein